MTTIKHYRICGLTVASELDLSVAAGEEEPGADARVADVVIRRGSVPNNLEQAKQTGPTWQVTDRQVLLLLPGVARFLMTEGREIAVEPEGNGVDENFRIFLLGSAMGALMHQRGALVLHAGAVAVNGEGVLFCGPSGAGKSSLVAALCASGYPLITDDVCLLHRGPSGRPMVSPDGRRLKLWADAIENLPLSAGSDIAVRPGIQKYWVEPPTPALRTAVPIRAVYFLRVEAPPYRIGIETLSVLEAVVLMRDNAYRPRLVRVLRQEAEWLDHGLSLMSAGGAFRLTHRMSFDALPACVQNLERHWHTLGYTSAA
jgi:hypothetical protein